MVSEDFTMIAIKIVDKMGNKVSGLGKEGPFVELVEETHRVCERSCANSIGSKEVSICHAFIDAIGGGKLDIAFWNVDVGKSENNLGESAAGHSERKGN